MQLVCIKSVVMRLQQMHYMFLNIIQLHSVIFKHICCSYNYDDQNPTKGWEQLGDCRLFSGKASQV